MPSRRDQIRMSPAEIRAYLLSQPRMIVVTNGLDGLPHPVPMNFALDDADRILITTFRKSQKVRNLERDPRAALLVESGHAYADIKSVIAYADAEIIDDPVRIRETVRGLRWTVGTSPITPGSEMEGQIDESFAKRVIVRFTPFRYVSWDHAKLGGHY
jgi:nitroimidazol reductase NimA-like FMN-containing flavoprotein (pyridoxamine 5'-phosphate oxidase superfamily)